MRLARLLAVFVVVCLGVVGGLVGCGGSANTSNGSPDAGGCPSGQQSCNGSCTNPTVDPANCGACGKSCGPGGVCVQGTCSASCGVGTESCGGKCVDIHLDPANC